jgi:small subunit ribosomal protein S13
MADTTKPTAAPAKEAKQEKPKESKDSGKDKEAKQASKMEVNKKDYPADFRFLVRILNTDLDGRKPVGVALAYVPGVGKRLAPIVARDSNVDPFEMIGNLKEEQIQMIGTVINELTETLPTWMVNRRMDPETGEDRHMVGTEITIMLREDLNRLKKIRSWRGWRHERKLPTRGQRTKANGRFGPAVGVQRKAEPGAPADAAPAAAAAPKAAGGGGAKPLGGAKPAAAPAAAAAKPAAPAGAKK